MASLSVRGIDEELAARLKKLARESDKSVNQLVVECLRKSVGMDKEKKFTKVHTDLDRFFGSWSDSEFKRIQGKVDSERQVDKELWK